MFELLFLLFLLAYIAVFSCVFAWFIFTMLIPLLFYGAFYAKTQETQLATMVSLAIQYHSQKAADLGAGDGSIVIALAQKGIEAHGYEINPVLVWKARQKIKTAGLQKMAFMHWGNFWKKNLSKFDIIIIYGISFLMKKLEKKLAKEMRNNAIVISNSFCLPGWKPVKKENGVLLYQR